MEEDVNLECNKLAGSSVMESSKLTEVKSLELVLTGYPVS